MAITRCHNYFSQLCPEITVYAYTQKSSFVAASICSFRMGWDLLVTTAAYWPSHELFHSFC